MSNFEEISEQIDTQEQETPGHEHKMHPKPVFIRETYKGSEKLKDKVALITGGDSGIGRAVAVHFAREGADIAILYLSEDKDAEETKKLVEDEGRRCILIRGDLRNREYCEQAIEQVTGTYGKLNILVNHAGEQHPTDNFEELDLDLVEKTFQTNIISMYYLTKPALKHMKEGDCIITTSSVTGYYGSEHFLDYSATNGAITSFTRSLARNLASKKIRVNSVAPGPIWTPLIPSTFDDLESFGEQAPLGRVGQPCEAATCYVFLASDDASYMTGHTLHPDGGMFMCS